MKTRSKTGQAHFRAQSRRPPRALRGPAYWRSLEELANTEDFQNFLSREFPSQASQWLDPVGRRRFLKLMAASLALAGVGACTRQPEEKIVPYVQAPEELIPGRPLFFATAFTLGGYATGVLVESHLGRPTKVEGNPDHPSSLGACGIHAQASLLDLYDPDRSQVVQRAGRISTWSAFLEALKTELEVQGLKKGAGLRLLTETVTSPSLASQIQALLERYPAARWHQYEPVGRDHAREGARMAFGEWLETRYRLDRAEVVLSLDSDFLTSGAGCLRYARDFMSRRRIGEEALHLNRLYVAESTPSSTGAVADHRLPLRPREIESFARSLAARLGLPVASGPEFDDRGWIEAVARDLESHAGNGLVMAGDSQPPVVHALVHAINERLANTNQTVVYTDPVEARPLNQMDSLRALVQDMQDGRVDVLVVVGGNPVYTAPVDLDFRQHFLNVRQRIHLSLYLDETSLLSHWHVPAAHYLESWGDARAHDGTVSIIQPLIAPLYGGQTPHRLLAVLLGDTRSSSHELVRGYWASQRPQEDFERFWQKTLHDGVMQDTALAAREVELKLQWPVEERPAAGRPARQLEILFRPDPTIHDGRFANNGWLQELPKPLTKLTWDNPALISPGTAGELGLDHEELVDLVHQGRQIQVPVWIMPGQPDGVVTVHLGYGRSQAGRVGSGAGFNVYDLRSSTSLWSASGIELRRTGQRYPLAGTQHHHLMDLSAEDRQAVEARPLIRSATLEEYRRDPEFAHHRGHPPSPEVTLYPPHPYPGYAWGMAINLNACIGCNACMVACQSENNIPIVGKDEVKRGREMHWIRIDRHYRGDIDNPETHYQPVPCMHCENAPCEPVCPVGATVHSREGLNEMVYNRCVGTRYCSNNCPYKVRRFNFLLYSDFETPSLKLMRNPDVTVRSRGVMEKCTYCVQRINAARIEAKRENRRIRDGDVVTACQQACPTEAIVFGDINDPESRVSKMKASSLNYGILEELNTRPRTTYWARLRNPNPALEDDD